MLKITNLFLNKIVLIFAALSIVFYLILNTIYAQTPQNFDATVAPTFFDLSSKPESTINETVRVRNNTNSEISLSVEVKRMGADDQGALTIKDDDDGTLSWIELKDKKISVKPREWAIIPFSIQIPKSAAFGYYWALSFTQATSSQQSQTGAKVNASIAVPILLSVTKEGAVTQGKLVEFKTDKSYYEYLPVNFITTFSNTGNVHIRPRGNIFIEDFLGRRVATLEINEASGAILPNVKRVFEKEWKDSFAYYDTKTEDGEVILDKNGKPKKELKFDFRKILDLRIGKYTASEVLLISGEKRDYVFEKTISFVVFPWKIILGMIVFVIFAGIGLSSTIGKIIGIIRKWFGRKNKE